jgi:hypothetical protein
MSLIELSYEQHVFLSNLKKSFTEIPVARTMVAPATFSNN